jgi:lysozyme
MPQVSENAVQIIKHFESFRDTAYLCPAGVWTVGYGTTAWGEDDPVCQHDTITRDQADIALRSYIRREIEPAFHGIFPQITEQNKIDALASMLYNFGVEKMLGFPITKRINNGQLPEDTARNMVQYNKASTPSGLKPLLGLHRRRMVEAALYLGLPDPLRFSKVGWTDTPETSLLPEYYKLEESRVREDVSKPEQKTDLPVIATKPIEQSKTVDGRVHERAGAESEKIGGVLGFGSVLAMVQQWATSMTVDRIVVLVFFIAALAWAWGRLRRHIGVELKKKGREEASSLKY